MRQLLLSKLNIKKIALETSRNYKSFTNYPLEKQSINAICYIIARDYFKQHFAEPNKTFTPSIHPQLQVYLRSMDVDKNSTTNLYDKHDRELSELSERLVNNVWTDIEELRTVFESRNDGYQEYQSKVDIEKTPEVNEMNSVKSEEEGNKNMTDQAEPESLFKVFDRELLQKLHEKNSQYDKEVRRALKEIGESDSGTRPLQRVTTEIIDKIQTLKGKYPNMIPFLDYVDKCAALSEHNPFQEFYMPPVLLVSKPGLGKTACVKDVAAAIGVPYGFVDYSTASAAWILVGVSSVWNSAKPGLIYDLLIKKTNSANSLILCDEIDKSKPGEDKYPPINVFYRLLEKDMMRDFTDEYLPQLELDASRVMYVATANSTETIPEAILSRFHVIYIEQPGPSQLRTIAKSIYRSIIESESYRSFASSLKDEVIDCLLGYSPRQIKVVLKLAFASAAYRLRHEKGIESITIETEDLDLPDIENESRQIGFVWN